VRVIMTLLVRDEQDVIAENIAYHLSRGVDHVIVTDNASTDAARDIVRAFERTGAVTLIDEPGDDYSQAAWVTRMARLAAEMDADWVINSDADEIWWPQGSDLKTEFAAFSRECGSATVKRSRKERMPSVCTYSSGASMSISPGPSHESPEGPLREGTSVGHSRSSVVGPTSGHSSGYCSMPTAWKVSTPRTWTALANE